MSIQSTIRDLKDHPEGDVLAQDVRDAKGNCLLPEGAVLTAESIAQLARRGILSVSVLHKEERTPQQLEALRIEMRARLDARFRRVENDPLMGTLKQMLLAYRLEQLQ